MSTGESTKDYGGPAFPHPDYLAAGWHGMSLRDYFAAKALPLAWAQEQKAPTGAYSEHMEPTYKGAAERAYYMADAMLKVRSK